MRAIFLDIDGVLNNDYTKEKMKLWDEELTGIDKRLAKMFIEWLDQHDDVQVVLSSSWRLLDKSFTEVVQSGIRIMESTPHLPGRLRGEEIKQILDKGYISKYVILDDFAPNNFLKEQRKYLIQTSPKHGLRQKNLDKAEWLLL